MYYLQEWTFNLFVLFWLCFCFVFKHDYSHFVHLCDMMLSVFWTVSFHLDWFLFFALLNGFKLIVRWNLVVNYSCTILFWLVWLFFAFESTKHLWMIRKIKSCLCLYSCDFSLHFAIRLSNIILFDLCSVYIFFWCLLVIFEA